MRRTFPALLLGGLLLLDLGARMGAALTPPATAGEVTAEPRRHLVCRHFAVNMDEDGGLFETADTSGEIGQWVSSHEAVGWRVASTDLEVGQKATGLMNAWTQVCLERSL